MNMCFHSPFLHIPRMQDERALLCITLALLVLLVLLVPESDLLELLKGAVARLWQGGDGPLPSSTVG